jgi:hypothetical protein
VGLQFAIGNEEDKCTELKNIIEANLAQSERIRLLRQQIASKRAATRKLQEVHDRACFVFEERKRQHKLRLNVITSHLEQMSQSNETLHKNSTTLAVHESAKMPKLRSQLDILGSRCERRQRQIALAVSKAFEIVPDKTGKWLTINGLAIYKKYVLYSLQCL